MPGIASLKEPAFGWVLRDCYLVPTNSKELCILVTLIFFNLKRKHPASFDAFTNWPFGRSWRPILLIGALYPTNLKHPILECRKKHAIRYKMNAYYYKYAFHLHVLDASRLILDPMYSIWFQCLENLRKIVQTQRINFGIVYTVHMFFWRDWRTPTITDQ